MATSQNGWPAYNTTASFVRGDAAGFRFWAADDDVRYLVEYLIRRFNAEVEPITAGQLDDWSWANRNVRGSDTSVSNHASATAWDLNALKHPRGVKNTFTARQEAAVNQILDSIVDDRGQRVFRWGEDYKASPVDGMHFEINVGRASVKQARARLEKKNPPQAAPEDTDMDISDADADKIARKLLGFQFGLTAAAAREMTLDDLKRKEGQPISLSYLVQWGGPGLFRIYKLLQSIAGQQAEILALLKASRK